MREETTSRGGRDWCAVARLGPALTLRMAGTQRLPDGQLWGAVSLSHQKGGPLTAHSGTRQGSDPEVVTPVRQKRQMPQAGCEQLPDLCVLQAMGRRSLRGAAGAADPWALAALLDGSVSVMVAHSSRPGGGSQVLWFLAVSSAPAQLSVPGVALGQQALLHCERKAFIAA